MALEIIHNDWLPDESTPEVQQLLNILRQCLAESGVPNSDVLLLKIGLTEPGRQRGVEPPMLALNENRGGFSKRRQEEAASRVDYLNRAVSTARQCISQLSPDTLEAFQQIVNWLDEQLVPNDDFWLDNYQALTTAEADELGKFALAFIEHPVGDFKQIGHAILAKLTRLRESPLSELICQKLLQQCILDTDFLYRDASEEIAGILVSSITKEENEKQRNLMILALAWTRSQTAASQFFHWLNQGTSWTPKPRLPISFYIPFAGWCLTSEGTRRNLISTKCYRLIPAKPSDTWTIPSLSKLEEQFHRAAEHSTVC